MSITDFATYTQTMNEEDWDILETMYSEHEFHLTPSRLRNFTNVVTLNWTGQLFTETNSVLVPPSPGIYAFCIEPRITDNLNPCFLMYFGQAVNLRRRYGEYLREIRGRKGVGRPSVKRLNIYKLNGYLYFYFAPVNPPTIPNITLANYLDSVERSLVNAFTPPVNKDMLSAHINRVESAF